MADASPAAPTSGAELLAQAQKLKAAAEKALADAQAKVAAEKAAAKAANPVGRSITIPLPTISWNAIVVGLLLLNLAGLAHVANGGKLHLPWPSPGASTPKRPDWLPPNPPPFEPNPPQAAPQPSPQAEPVPPAPAVPATYQAPASPAVQYVPVTPTYYYAQQPTTSGCRVIQGRWSCGR